MIFEPICSNWASIFSNSVMIYFRSVSSSKSIIVHRSIMARPSSLFFALFGILSLALITVSATGKLENVAFPDATMFFTKCFAPLSSVFSVGMFHKPEPVCSAEEFSSYAGYDLMKLDGKQIGSLPPSYFESLKIGQATQLGAPFINRLGKEQAMAFTKEAEAALPRDSRKVLNKIKKKPGPVARGIILALSGVTAFIIFKYS